MKENVEGVVTETAARFSETENGGAPYLPECIVRNILVRLPVKCQIRFKSVCKYWLDIICELLMLRVMIIYPTEDPRSSFFKLKNNGKDVGWCFKRKKVWMEEACNNFVLLRRTFGFVDMLYFYDAIDPQCRQLPKIPGFHLHPTDTCSLVYDASAKTSKVIVFHGNHFKCYSIYSLNGGSENWRTSSFPDSQEIMESCVPVDLNGVLYWIAEDRYHGAIIQPLDIAEEELMSIVEVPCRHWSFNCSLLKIKGSLCFMNTDCSDELHIWVLEDSVEIIWTPQHKISLSSMFHRPVSLCSFLQNGFHPRQVVDGCSTTYILVTIDGISAPYWYEIKTNKLIQIIVDCNNLEACHLRTVSLIYFDLTPEFEASVQILEDLAPELEYMVSEWEDTMDMVSWLFLDGWVRAATVG